MSDGHNQNNDDLPHHPPEYAFASVPHFRKPQKENHSVSNPFQTHCYDDGEEITPVSVKHLHTHGKTYMDEEDEQIKDKTSPQRRPSIDNIKFQEGRLEVAHLPRTLSAHAKGPTFPAPQENDHPVSSFQPPGSEPVGSSVISQKHNWHHAHFEMPGAKDEKNGEPIQARYHHYTAPHDHAYGGASTSNPTPHLVNEDEIDPYDPYASAKLKSLDASPSHNHDQDLLLPMHHSQHHAHHHQHQTLHETHVGGQRPATSAAGSRSPEVSPPKDDFHGKPLFSPQEAKRLQEQNFSHEKPIYSSGLDARTVFGFGTRELVDEHGPHHGTHAHLVEDASGHISAGNVVSGVGNAYLDDEPTVRQVQTKSKEDMWK